MATRKTASSAKRTGSGPTAGKAGARRNAPAAHKPGRPAPDTPGKAKSAGRTKTAATGSGREPRRRAPATPADAPAPRTPAARERRFNQLLQTACLKAGTAAAITTISRQVPFLGKLAPVVLGSVGESLTLARVQQQLVRDVIELYQLELSEPEERGVILLATAVNIGAQQISKQTVEQLIEQVSGRLYRPVISRVLPLASVSTEVAAAVAGTYAVGKRAQALCRLPGTGARDLGELLRSLSGIDQARLFSWTADAFALALKPFRGALIAMVPGLGAFSGKR